MSQAGEKISERAGEPFEALRGDSLAPCVEVRELRAQGLECYGKLPYRRSRRDEKSITIRISLNEAYELARTLQDSATWAYFLETNRTDFEDESESELSPLKRAISRAIFEIGDMLCLNVQGAKRILWNECGRSVLEKFDPEALSVEGVISALDRIREAQGRDRVACYIKELVDQYRISRERAQTLMMRQLRRVIGEPSWTVSRAIRAYEQVRSNLNSEELFGDIVQGEEEPNDNAT